MRLFTARRLALAALAPLLLVLSVVPGCSGEGEGERCGDSVAPNDGDCASGLTCLPFSALLNNDGVTNRCCYTDRVTDSRCQKSGGSSATGVSPDAGSEAGAAGSSAAGAAGSSEAGAAGSSAAGAGSGGMSSEPAGAGGV